MPCPACGSECREGAAFCDGCGARVGLTCGRCGTALRAGARFCDACGAPVGAASPPVADPRAYTPRHLAEKILTSRSAITGERKQVTVLFADVKGSMDLAEQVDAEDWHAIMDGFFGILADGVHRYEGTINQYTGDGIMALFGAPIAHEDHARRACLAALHLADALRRYADELRRTRGLSFAVRMGLNSGEVVVGAIGDDLRMDYTAQGYTVGLAARMEQLAEPGKVYVTQETAALVEGYFRLRDLGVFDVKGVRQPVRVLELEGIGALRTRLDVSRARGFSRFVGREDEMAVLEGALSAAAGGRGQVVGVVAEAGVGKSRLCWEFVERCRARGLTVHQAQAVAHGRAVPYLVALELARSWFGVTAQDGDQATRKKIAGTLVLVDEDLRDALPLVCEFLGVADPERPAPRLEPEARSRRLLAVMKRIVRAQSRTAPVVILVEDLHWMDGGSETFLLGVIDAVPGSRTLLLANFRPEYQWTHQQVALHPLRPAASSALLEDLLGPDPALAGLAARMAEHTHGNPFFLEELVRGLVETGTLAGTRGAYRLAGPAEVTIPPSVQAVLAARIDRLGEREKAVLQTAAVIGTDVPEAVLARVAEQVPAELESALHALTLAEFLYEVPGQGYSFAHPLTQEVAYRTQLAERRGRVHAAVARAIAALDGERLDERAALLAHHWAGAGEAVEAARWHRRAAIWVGASDFQAARHHWQEIRRVLAGAPETDETNALRIDAIGGILTASARLGLDAAEKAALVAELEALAARIGDAGMRVTALAGPAGIRLMAGDPEGAIGPLQEAARLAAVTSERGTEMAVHAMLALALFVAGRFPEAVDAVEHTLAREPADLQLGAHLFGFSPYLMALTFRGVLHRMMGRLGDGQRDLDRAAELARAHGQLEMQGYVAQGHSFIAHARGDADTALSHARVALAAAERIDSPFSRTQAYEALGAAYNLGARWAEARDAYERALAIMHQTGTGFTDEAFYLAGLAQAHLGAGDLVAARARAEEAVAAGERRHTRFAACMAYLALGQVLAAHDDPGAWDAAERALTTALALVGETGAVTSEPFVHVELAAVARRRGDAVTARREQDTARRQFTAIGAPLRAAAIENARGQCVG